MNSLAGKVVLVTGGGAGMGRALVNGFVKEGARVGVLERCASLVQGLQDEFGSAVCVTCGDVRSATDNLKAVEEVVKQFGRLDVFIGNAGIYDNRAQLIDFDLDELNAGFDELFSVNVKGYMLGALAAAAELKKTRGSIIFTASVSSMQPGFGGVLYVSAKHAVAGLTRQLALELSPFVRVNAIAPGYVPTTLRGMESLSQGATATAPVTAQMPLQELPRAEDYVPFYILLASEQGRVTTTGSILLADGGLSLGSTTKNNGRHK